MIWWKLKRRFVLIDKFQYLTECLVNVNNIELDVRFGMDGTEKFFASWKSSALAGKQMQILRNPYSSPLNLDGIGYFGDLDWIGYIGSRNAHLKRRDLTNSSSSGGVECRVGMRERLVGLVLVVLEWERIWLAWQLQMSSNLMDYLLDWKRSGAGSGSAE